MEYECAHADKVNGLCKICLRREVEEQLAQRTPPLPRERIRALTSEWIRACESPLWPT